APWNYAPGTNPNIEVAIETAYQIEVMHKTHLAILTDPSVMNTLVKVEERVAAYLHHPINTNGGCVQEMPAQNASNGEDSQVAKIRACHGAGVNVDAALANDRLYLPFVARSGRY